MILLAKEIRALDTALEDHRVRVSDSRFQLEMCAIEETRVQSEINRLQKMQAQLAAMS